MELSARTFEELTNRELYEILRARAEIFVVEQACVYQDLDGRDYESLHVFFEEEGKVTACLRAFFLSPDTVRMGRVLTREHGKGLGGRLLKEGIALVRERMKPARIRIEAQTYAAPFYAREGFRICSEEFEEDGIPHVGMVLDLKDP